LLASARGGLIRLRVEPAAAALGARGADDSCTRPVAAHGSPRYPSGSGLRLLVAQAPVRACPACGRAVLR
jgi:hypothetical protein